MQSTVATLPFNPLQVDAGCGLTIEDYLNVFHGDMGDHSYVHHAYIDPTRETKKKQWIPWACSSLEEYGQRLTFNHSEYVSLNTSFYKRRKVKFISDFDGKTVRNVHELNAFYLDIDINDEDAKFRGNHQRFFDTLNSMVRYGIIPPYTFLVNSGNGYYVIWLIEKIRFSRRKNMEKKVDETLAIHKEIQKYLVSLFTDFGADAKVVDALRVLGLPGTYNCKKGEKKRRYIMEYNEGAVITMKEFRQEYLPKEIDDGIFKRFYPEFPNKDKKQAQKKSTTKKTQNEKKPTRHKSASTYKRFNTVDKHKSIIADIHRLFQLRSHMEDGLGRDSMCFLLRYSWNVLANDEVAVEKMLELNSKFKVPYEREDIIERTQYAVTGAEDFKSGKVINHEGKLVRAGYNYSKIGLIRELKIKEEEYEHLHYMVDPKLTLERKLEKQKESLRDDYGLTKRDNKVLDTFIKIQQCKNEGKTQVEVAEATGIALRTVERNWNMPNSKNSELIYHAYREKMIDEEVQENPSDKRCKTHRHEISCYVMNGVETLLEKNPVEDKVAVIDDGSFEYLAQQAEVLTMEDLQYIRDSEDPDDSKFECTIGYAKTIYDFDGRVYLIADGITICVYDENGNFLWRDPCYYKKVE